MRRLKGASLLEAIVAALVFLIVFATAMELLPRLAIRDDGAVLLAEADYRVGNVLQKYATGQWPEGKYEEQYDWGRIEVQIAAYRHLRDMVSISVVATIEGSHKHITITQLIACSD